MIRAQFRRDTAANWTAVNPILLQGEPGYEYDTGRFKVGDGVTPWASLAYNSGAQGAAGPTGAQGPAGAQGPQNSLAKSTTYTAVNGDMLLCDTSSAGFTVTLPPSPSTGWSIVFEDAAGTWGINALTLGANGNKIMGVVADYPLQISGTRVTVVYSGSANGWRVYQ